MALATADIHVKIDPMVKKKAERKFKAAGITMSDFINIELRKVVRGDRKVEKVVDEALPENLRIESEEQLIELLKKRLEKEEKEQKKAHLYVDHCSTINRCIRWSRICNILIEKS